MADSWTWGSVEVRRLILMCGLQLVAAAVSPGVFTWPELIAVSVGALLIALALIPRES